MIIYFFTLLSKILERGVYSVYVVESYRKYLNPVMAVNVFTAFESVK